MSTLSSANVTDINLVLKERTHMHLCINMLIFTHNLGNWLILNATLHYVAWPKSKCNIHTLSSQLRYTETHMKHLQIKNSSMR